MKEELDNVAGAVLQVRSNLDLRKLGGKSLRVLAPRKVKNDDLPGESVTRGLWVIRNKIGVWWRAGPSKVHSFLSDLGEGWR